MFSYIYTFLVLVLLFFVQSASAQQARLFNGTWTGDVKRNNQVAGHCKMTIGPIVNMNTFNTGNTFGECEVSVELFDMADKSRNNSFTATGKYVQQTGEKAGESISFSIKIPDKKYKSQVEGAMDITMQDIDGTKVLRAGFLPRSILSSNYNVEEWLMLRAGDGEPAGTSDKPGENNAPYIIANEVQGFREGFCIIRRGEHYAIIDTLGNYLINFGQYVFPEGFNNRATIGDQYGFKYGLCLVMHPLTGMNGYINKKGELQIPCMFSEALPFESDGYADVKVQMPNKMKKNLYVNTKGELYEAVPNVLEYAFTDGLLLTPHGYFDRMGNLVLSTKGFKHYYPFNEGLAAASIENQNGQELWGFIDKTGRFVIQPQFTWPPDHFSNGLARVTPYSKDDYLYSYINKKGKIVFHVNPPASWRLHFHGIKKYPHYYFPTGFKRHYDSYGGGGYFYKGYAYWVGGYFYDTTGKLRKIDGAVDFNKPMGQYIHIKYIGDDYMVGCEGNKCNIYDHNGNTRYKSFYYDMGEPDAVSQYVVAGWDNEKGILNRNEEIVFKIRIPKSTDAPIKLVEPDPVTITPPEIIIKNNKINSNPAISATNNNSKNSQVQKNISANNQQVQVVKGIPDNEGEAEYFTAATENGRYTIYVKGKIDYKNNKTDKPHHFKTTGFTDGNHPFLVNNLFIVERGTDFTLISEASDGESNYTVIDNIDKNTAKSKWSKKLAALTFASPGADISNVYISTDTEIIKLSLETGAALWKQPLNKLKVPHAIGAIEYKNGKLYCKRFMSDSIVVVLNALTGQVDR